MSDSVRGPARGAWLAIAALVSTWLVLDFMVQVARDQALSLWDITSPRATVATRAMFNVALLWAALAATRLILLARGQTFADLGWRRAASTRAWVLAIGLAALYVGAVGATFGGDAALLSDWSLYRISLAFVLGISAGVCGELIFRGFVMGQARDAGLGVALQVIFSSVLFALALARFGWGGTTSPEWWSIIAVIVPTTILGASFAGIYLMGRRSLMPVVVAHTMIDMALQPGVLQMAYR